MTKIIGTLRHARTGTRRWTAMGASATCLAAALIALPAQAQSDTDAAAEDASDNDIIVTATKRGDGERLQDVPIAITAFAKAELDRSEFRGLESIGNVAPNVQLNPIGTVKGTANFTIRGLGTNSSIPSLDPTVGVFVDGVYLGTSAGVLLDGFDIEAIELLRGPQGILFGKNVTGGAVVIRTTTPGKDTIVDVRAGIETGPNYTASAVVSGPVVTDLLSIKAAGYFNKDEGWFENEADGNNYGGSRTAIGRLAFALTPSPTFSLVGRFEIGDIDARDETPSQNRAIYDPDSFDVAGSRIGGADIRYKNATLEANLDVGFGDGRITNIFGWRKLDTAFGLDVDSLPGRFFEQYQIIDQKQFSNELRYAGTFGDLSLLTGAYWFEQTVEYFEQRKFGNGAAITSTTAGGGTLDSTTYGLFGSLDWKVTPEITLSAGARYTRDEKSAIVAAIRPGGCDFDARTCTYEFSGKDAVNGLTPKFGIAWQPDRDTLVYANVSRGLRGGGFNIRSAAVNVLPGPFDDEKVLSYELGTKLDLADRRLRLNLVLFRTEVKKMQREVNTVSPTSVIVQVIENTADATIQGVEAEAVLQAAEGLTISGNVGITSGEYKKIFADINRDGVINSADLNLKIPRLVPLTLGTTVDYRRDTRFGSMGVRASYNYRDASWFSDANVPGTKLQAANMIDASLTFDIERLNLSAALYAKNLLNEVTEGSITALPAAFGGPGATYAPLNKGRVFGVSLRFNLK